MVAKQTTKGIHTEGKEYRYKAWQGGKGNGEEEQRVMRWWWQQMAVCG